MFAKLDKTYSPLFTCISAALWLRFRRSVQSIATFPFLSCFHFFLSLTFWFAIPCCGRKNAHISFSPSPFASAHFAHDKTIAISFDVQFASITMPSIIQGETRMKKPKTDQFSTKKFIEIMGKLNNLPKTKRRMPRRPLFKQLLNVNSPQIMYTKRCDEYICARNASKSIIIVVIMACAASARDKSLNRAHRRHGEAL